MEKQANSSDRHQAVVKGQEDLTGIKEVRIKRVLKRNTDNEVVVSQSTRYEMLYDSVEEAERAYKNIIDAQEVAEFDGKQGDDMNFDKDANIHTGMKIKGCRVGVYNPLTDTFEISNHGCTATINKQLLKLAAGNENIGVCAKCGAIYPVDLGMGGVNNNPAQDPTDFSKGTGEGQAITLCPFCGKSVQPNIEQPITFMPDTFGRGLPKIPNEVKAASESLIEPGFPISDTEHELQLGVRRETEHTSDTGKATEIAIDHLSEDPKYYTKLNQVLPEEGVEKKPKRDVKIAEADSTNVEDMISNAVEAAAKEFINKIADIDVTTLPDDQALFKFTADVRNNNPGLHDLLVHKAQEVNPDNDTTFWDFAYFVFKCIIPKEFRARFDTTEKIPAYKALLDDILYAYPKPEQSEAPEQTETSSDTELPKTAGGPTTGDLSVLNVDELSGMEDTEQAKEKASEMLKLFFPNESWANMQIQVINKMNSVEEIANYMQYIKDTNELGD